MGGSAKEEEGKKEAVEACSCCKGAEVGHLVDRAATEVFCSWEQMSRFLFMLLL